MVEGRRRLGDAAQALAPHTKQPLNGDRIRAGLKHNLHHGDEVELLLVDGILGLWASGSHRLADDLQQLKAQPGLRAESR